MGEKRPTRHEKENDIVSGDTDSRSLIPEHIVDQASQRLFVVSLFVLLQCWKIYDILLVKADVFALASASSMETSVQEHFTNLNNFTFVLKYALIDGLFLWFLPVLNIPLLTFSPLATLLLTIGTNAFTFLLASNIALPVLSGVVLPLWNILFKKTELTIMGNSATYKNVVNVNEHFKGRYTIQYLPASSVKLNPFHYDHMCIESSYENNFFPHSIMMPIEFNTTTDVNYMQISHTSPANEVTIMNYTSTDIRKLQKRDYSHLSQYPNYVYKDERVFYLEIKLTEPGRYAIYNVVDSDGMKIRPYKSDFTVGLCPTAKFVYPGAEPLYSGYKCINRDIDQEFDWALPLVSTFGVSPVTAEIMATTNGKTLTIFNATISQHLSKREGLEWLQTQDITRNSLEQEILRNPSIFRNVNPGKLEFQILSVSDEMNNKRTYNPASKDPDVNFSIELKESVPVSLIDKNPHQPLLIGRSKTLYLHAKSALSKKLSFVIQYQEDSTSSSENFTITFADMDEFKKGFSISKPGIYRLAEGEDNHCPCIVDSSKSVSVESPAPPTVNISGTPIEDKCVGTVGFEFDLQFTGQAPFEISYNVFKNISGVLRPILSERGLKEHVKRSADQNYKFQYKPRQEGSYVLVFKTAKDKYYTDRPVLINEEKNTFATYFNRRSNYRFFDGLSSKQLSVCKGGSTEIPVHFEGNFPFSFKYEIRDMSGKVVESKKVKNQILDTFVIKTPEFDKGGNFKVFLLDVMDNLECPAEKPDFDVSIKARAEAPSVKFEKSFVFEILEGETISVPLKMKNVVEGQRNTIGFTKSPLLDTSASKKIVTKEASVLRLSEEGVYRLESFENGECPGTIEESNLEIKVVYAPKPNLTVAAENIVTNEGMVQLGSCCQSSEKSVNLVFEGKKPFVIPYNVRYPNGKVESSSISIDKDNAVFPLPTNAEGNYVFEFNGIYDSLYTQKVFSRLSYSPKSVIVNYGVLGSPKFAVSQQYLQFCETAVTEENAFPVRVPISFEGQFPFTVRGSIRKSDSHSEETFEISGIDSAEINMMDSKLKHKLSVGEHIITFNEVIDGNGCRLSKLNNHNVVQISITKVPAISKTGNEAYYCVGDHVAYNMSGVSPFTVFYNFNGQTRKTELGFDFRRLASKPGDLEIVALQDSSATLCLVNFTFDSEAFNKLKLHVHALPSVEISHGDSIIENLNEGDQTEITFKFIGVPPFEVTYVRTLGEEEGRHKRRRGVREGHRIRRRVVDTKTIKEIWDYEYTEVVGLEGTYDAIRVSDAYCSASRDVNEIL